MIEGIEAFYQQIAESIQEGVPDPWSMAWIEATFFSEHIAYSAEYITADGSAPKSFGTTRTGRRAFEQLRELFRKAGKPLWCRACFEISADGAFNMKWNYDDCDENGFARFDEQAELERMRKLWNRQ